MAFPRMRLWLRAFFKGKDLEADLADEIRLHVEMETQKNIREGLDPVEARRRALIDFGGEERFKEQARDQRATRPVEDLAMDLRYGLRQLRKHPGFTAVAVLSLALGIGANTAIFSIVNAVLLRPLPFQDPDRIVVLEEWVAGEVNPSFSPRDFLDIKEQSTSFQHVVGYRGLPMSYMGAEGPERIQIQSVSPDFFRAFGAQPALGRFFEDTEAEDSGGRMAVLSHASWRTRFGADPSVVGRSINLDGNPHTVVGVALPSFRFPAETEIWVRSYRGGVPEPPVYVGEDLPTLRNIGYFRVAALLAPMYSHAEAQAELNLMADRLGEIKEVAELGYRLALQPLQEVMVGEVRTALLILLGAVGLVLLIACSNVANLLLARAATRSRELAVRTALGASRRRLFRQLLVESLLLGVVAGIAGLALARWGFGGLLTLLPSDIPRLDGVSLDPGVLLFTLGASLLTGLLFGLMPALEASRADLAGTIKEGGRGTDGGGRSKRSREFLVVWEVTLSVVLLAGAGLLFKSLVRLQAEDVGFDPGGVLTMRMSLPDARYPEEADLSVFVRDLLREVEVLPGVRSAGVALGAPFVGGTATLMYEAEGFLPSPGEEFESGYQAVSRDYMRTMGVPLLAGRGFIPEDEEGEGEPRVVLVNEALARRHWGAPEAALGGGIRYHQDEFMEIVGVVGDLRHFSFDRAPRPEAFTPFQRDPWPFFSLVVKAEADPIGLVDPVRQAVLTLDPLQPVYDIRTMDAALWESVGQERFTVLLLGLFAALALVLAVVGVYGLVAYSASLRIREMGIRVALGATKHRILWLGLQSGIRLSLLGLVLGIGLSLAVTRVMRSMLYGVSPWDPGVLVLASLALVASAVGAAYLPARKAAGSDPATVLRSE